MYSDIYYTSKYLLLKLMNIYSILKKINNNDGQAILMKIRKVRAKYLSSNMDMVFFLEKSVYWGG